MVTKITIKELLFFLELASIPTEGHAFQVEKDRIIQQLDQIDPACRRIDEGYLSWSILRAAILNRMGQDPSLINLLFYIGAKHFNRKQGIVQKGTYSPVYTKLFNLVRSKFKDKFGKTTLDVFLVEVGTFFKSANSKTQPDTREGLPDARLVEYLNTVWYFYMPENRKPKSQESPATEISRHLLSIDSKGIATLYSGSSGEWKGKSNTDIVEMHMIVYDLVQVGQTDRHLEIRFKKTQVIDETIILGQYIRTESTYHIVSGSFVMQNVDGAHVLKTSEAVSSSSDNRKISIHRNGIQQTYRLISKRLTHDSKWQEEIPEPIAMFLQHKWKNFTKIKTNLLNLTDLANLLEAQKERPIKDNKYNSIIEYDALIITPTPEINANDDGKGRKLYDEVCNTFFDFEITSETDGLLEVEKKRALFACDQKLKGLLGFTRIYYHPRIRFSKGGTKSWKHQNRPVSVKHEMDAMRKSKCVIYILDEAPGSSSLVKIGFALAMEKVTFLVALKENILPTMLQQPFHKITYVPSGVRSVAEIPEAIKPWIIEDKVTSK